MPKYLTKTTLIGLTGPGQKVTEGKLIDLDPANPAHARLIQGGDVELYTEPKKPEEVKLGK